MILRYLQLTDYCAYCRSTSHDIEALKVARHAIAQLSFAVASHRTLLNKRVESCERYFQSWPEELAQHVMCNKVMASHLKHLQHVLSTCPD